VLNSMAKMLLVRLVRLLATLFAVTLLTFSMVSLLPGDPVDAILGQTERTPAIEEQLRVELKLDKPFHVRYVNWLGDAVQGDLGESYINRGQTVSGEIKNRLPVTGQLALMAIVMAVAVAAGHHHFSSRSGCAVGSELHHRHLLELHLRRSAAMAPSVQLESDYG
jgi:peptide/nickel transport system permease protein